MVCSNLIKKPTDFSTLPMCKSSGKGNALNSQSSGSSILQYCSDYISQFAWQWDGTTRFLAAALSKLWAFGTWKASKAALVIPSCSGSPRGSGIGSRVPRCAFCRRWGRRNLERGQCSCPWLQCIHWKVTLTHSFSHWATAGRYHTARKEFFMPQFLIGT